MSATQAYGANIAFIEELYERYRANPESVSASWREFFGEYRDGDDPLSAASRHPLPASEEKDDPMSSAPRPAERGEGGRRPGEGLALIPGATPLRGVAAKIAANMEASLGVP